MRVPDFRPLAMIGGIALACLWPVRGQSPQSFEVASIRPNPTGTVAMGPTFHVDDGGLVRITNASLLTLIREAYRVQRNQLEGGPKWLDTERYDIEAKADSSGRIQADQMSALLKSLLAERFQLRVHRETREMTVYALVVDKGGSKMKEHTDGTATTMSANRGPGKAQMSGSGVGMAQFANYVGNELGRTAIDKTGLKGGYDFRLEWDPEQSADSTGSSIFTALQEQLGLRLESQKGDVEMLVIDSAEKASQN